MLAKKTSSLIPTDVLAHKRQQAERVREEHQRAVDAERAAYARIAAEDLAARRGEAYEWEGNADKACLKKWVEAIAAHKALLPAWPNPDVPPADFSENEPPDGLSLQERQARQTKRQARHVAICIFLASDTAPDEAVKALTDLATNAPDFAASVGRWLRRGLWETRPAPPVLTPAPVTDTHEVDPALATAIAKLNRLVGSFEHNSDAGAGNDSPPNDHERDADAEGKQTTVGEPSDETTPHSDGPELPDKFWWKGESYEMQPTPCRLLSFLWDRPNGVKEDEVIEWVWGHDADNKRSALKSALNKTNDTLLEAAVPWSYGQKAGHIVKETSPRRK
jgi:hypothetical protein